MLPNSNRAVTALLVVLLACLHARTALGQGEWVQMGPAGGTVTAVAVHPLNPAIVYIGLPFHGVFRSTDAGGKWTAVNTGLTNLTVRRFAIDPVTPSIVYVLTDGGVFRSSNAGDTWSPASTGLPTLPSNPLSLFNPYSLVIDPVTPSRLYAIVGLGVYRSTNSGGIWTRVDTGLPGGGDGFIYSLVIDPVAPTTLYGAGQGRVFGSQDAGVSWTQVSTNLQAHDAYLALAIDPLVPTTLYYAGSESGVWRSLDSGVTWTHRPGSGGGTLAVDPVTPSTIYVGGVYGGVWKSTNGGGTWARADAGLYPDGTSALAISPSLPARLFAATFGGAGIFRSDNAAASWSAANNGLFVTTVQSLEPHPVTPSTVYAMLAEMPYSDDPSAVMRSTDMGASWTMLPLKAFDLAIDPVTPSTMYAGIHHGGVVRTTDGGTTWLPVNAGISPGDFIYPRSLAIDPLNPSTVYVATYKAVYRSTNRGDSWTTASGGLPVDGIGRYFRLVIDPLTPSTLYLSGETVGVYRTVNGGESWTQLTQGLAGVLPTTLAINPVNPSILYVGTWQHGVFQTTNGGTTWSPASAGLSPGFVSSLVVDPVNPSTVYAGTLELITSSVPAAGVFKSTNGGTTWTPMNEGLTAVSVRALAIDPLTPSILYAGTDFGSTFRWQPEGTRRLGVTKPGNGSGTVTSTTAGIQCGTDCAEEYALGAVVTLNAVAQAPSTFVSFGGHPDCSDGVVTMSDNRTCTATFSLPNYTLTVSRAGAGSGTVTSNVPGINCGTDCLESFPLGTVVTLTASPATGSTFGGWSGGCAGSALSCQVTMTQSVGVTAMFGAGLPGAFAKLSPLNGQIAVATSGLPLSWQAASSANTYEYCYDTTNDNSCGSSWVSTGATNATIGGLSTATTYYWQVRARNVTGTTEANGGTWWNFRTVSAPLLTMVSPTGGRRGRANLLVNLTGVFTHFVQGQSTASFGPGITVNSTSVQSAMQATANITIAGNASLGSRTVTVTTGGEVVTLTGGFLVTPASFPLGDFDGDARTDITVYRPANGTWYSLTSSSNFLGGAGYAWGVSTDLPVPSDFDGDGKTDVAVYRSSSSHWFILKSSSGFTTPAVYQWGTPGDRPVPGDYDGDGRTDLAIYRPSIGAWYILTSSTGFSAGIGYIWGVNTDVPVPADYDGDGRTDLALYRPSSGHWFILTSGTNFTSSATYQWGTSGDVPVQADFDGDDRRDLAIYRPSNGTWYFLKSSTGFTVGAGYAWGAGADVPVPGDYDGDGKTDIVVYRPSTGHWFILTSSTSYATSSTYQWGTAGDSPILKPQ